MIGSDNPRCTPRSRSRVQRLSDHCCTRRRRFHCQRRSGENEDVPVRVRYGAPADSALEEAFKQQRCICRQASSMGRAGLDFDLQVRADGVSVFTDLPACTARSGPQIPRSFLMLPLPSADAPVDPSLSDTHAACAPCPTFGGTVLPFPPNLSGRRPPMHVAQSEASICATLRGRFALNRGYFRGGSALC
ncbi:hypothetical protein B0H12DRAFT_478284 [Mycena haematopus]|nr:hypothetical protein B0H12DRAFT_478284 [Mycena haematopus]